MSRISQILRASLESESDPAKVDETPITPDVEATPATEPKETDLPAADAKAPDATELAAVDSNIDPAKVDVVPAAAQATLENEGEDPEAAAAAVDATPTTTAEVQAPPEDTTPVDATPVAEVIPAAAAPDVIEVPLESTGEPTGEPAPTGDTVADPAAESADPALEPAADPAITEEAPADVEPEADIVIEESTLPVEIVEAEDDVERATDAVDQFETVRSGLEDLAELIESTLPEGGMSPVTAEFATHAYDTYREAVGEQEEETAMPALEQFGGETDRYRTTVASMESAQALAAKVGNAIKEALKTLRAFLASMIGKLLQYIGSLNQRNIELGKRAKAAAGKTPAERTIELGAVAGRIAVGEQVSVKDFLGLPGLLDQAIKFDEKTDESLRKQHEAIAKFAASKSMDEEADAWGNAIATTFEPVPVPAAFRHHHESNGSQFNETDVLPGNVVLSLNLRLADTNLTGLKQILSFLRAGWRVEQTSKDVSLPENYEAPTLSLTDVAAIIKTVELIKAAGQRIDAQKNLDKLNFGEITIHPDSGLIHKRMAKELQAAFAARLGLSHQASAKLLSYALRTAAQYQTYAFKSLAQYGAGEGA